MHRPLKVIVVFESVALCLVNYVEYNLIVFFYLLVLPIFFLDLLFAVLCIFFDFLLKGKELVEIVPLVVDDRFKNELFLAIILVIFQAAKWLIGKRTDSTPIISKNVVQCPKGIPQRDHEIDVEVIQSFR